MLGLITLWDLRFLLTRQKAIEKLITSLKGVDLLYDMDDITI